MSGNLLSLVLKAFKLPIFILFCHGCSTKIVSGESYNSFTLIDILKDVQRLHGYEHILMMHNKNTTIAKSFACGFLNDTCNDNQLVRDVMENLQVPVWQSNEMGTFQLQTHYSARLLSLVYIDGAFSEHLELLRKLALHLDQIRTTNIIFLVRHEGQKEQLLTKLFGYCWGMKMINVVALFTDYRKTGKYYSYTHFPKFVLETKSLRVGEPIFPYRLRNLKGYKLSFIMGGAEPRIIVYKKPSGEKIVTGFVGHFISAFAEKHNLQLVEPLPAILGEFAPARELIYAVDNGTVEFSASITFPEIPFLRYTYPYEMANWCLMLPVEPEVEHFRFYFYVVKGGVIELIILTIVVLSFLLSCALYQAGYKPDLYELFLHDNCLRGVLGQSFSEILSPSVTVRFLYMQICCLGILLTTSYNSVFATYFTSAPRQPPFNSFNDILVSGKKLIVYKPEYKELIERAPEFSRYASMFHLEPNFKTYIKLRDSFNTEYGYMVPNSKWTIINQQQMVFTSPVFRHRTDLCLYHNIPLCFPVSDNSIYKQLLQQLMLEMSQSGLRTHWERNGFLELIAAKKLVFFDLSRKSEFNAMKVQDLRYVGIGMAIMHIVELFVFMAELFVFRRKAIYNGLRKWIL